jgi:hypothetical protein
MSEHLQTLHAQQSGATAHPFDDTARPTADPVRAAVTSGGAPYPSLRDLPADQLISFDVIAAYGALPGVTRRWLERATRDGRFVQGVRLTPRAKMLWRAGAVAAWVEAQCPSSVVSK